MRAIVSLSVLAACAGLAACDSRVSVEATANAGAQYASVLVTVKEVWVNESATAAPDDATWLKFPLAAPQTLELADVDNAGVKELASKLEVRPGTYRQIRLLLADRVEPLTASARSAGATFNDQVTFFDEAGVESTLPLELPAAAHGIGIETELDVPVAREAVIANLVAPAGATSGFIAPGNTIPGASLPGVTAPDTTLPDTTVPNPTLADMPVPDATIPEVAVPGTATSIPTMAGPVGTTNAEPTIPVITTPDTTPEPTIPEPTIPGETVGDTTIPVGSEPDVPSPEPPTPPPPSSSGTGTTVNAHAVTVTSTVAFDAARDLVPFRFSDRPGFLLSPTLSAHETDEVGSIQAELDIASIALDTGTGRPDVEVTAERLNDDASRRVVVASAPVRADGTFTLYPLPFDAGAAESATYDLVIHGPAITTVVIRGVPVTKGTPGGAANVALGTITLLPADTYRVNLAAGSAVAPLGARVQFYQTLADDSAPFVIEQRPVDPLTGRFAADEPLSAAPLVVYGTFGEAFSLVAAAPQEGAASYSVAAFAGLFGAGELSATPLTGPSVAGGTAAFTVPAIAVPAPATAGTITAKITATTPGKYDDGALLVTHDGAIVTAAPLSAVLGRAPRSNVVNVADVPASASSALDGALYYLEVWAWNSANPEGSFTRQPVGPAVDLRGTANASTEILVD
jgi:hypothetical protein